MIRIAIAAREDAAVLAEVMRRSWGNAFRGILSDAVIAQYTAPESCTAMFSQILTAVEGTMYLARMDGAPVGLMYLLEDENSLRIEALLTVPEAWGCGVGPALMEKALEDAAVRGKEDIRVRPFAQNARARRFYEKWNFAPTGRNRLSDALEVEYVCDVNMKGSEFHER